MLRSSDRFDVAVEFKFVAALLALCISMCRWFLLEALEFIWVTFCVSVVTLSFFFAVGWTVNISVAAGVVGL